MESFKSRCTKILSQIRPNATFLTIHGYCSNHGEIADVSVLFHINYEHAILRSKDILFNMIPVLAQCENQPFTFLDLQNAREELLESFEDTLSGFNPRCTTRDVYEDILDVEHNPIPGIKLYKEKDVIHLFGYRIHKLVIMEGTYKKVNSSPKTIAKNYLRKLLPISRFSQYALEPGKFREIIVEGCTIREKDVIRESESWRKAS